MIPTPTTIAVLLALACAVCSAEPILLFENSDFEKGTLENWMAVGDAFLRQPTKGDNPAARSPPLTAPSCHGGIRIAICEFALFAGLQRVKRQPSKSRFP